MCRSALATIVALGVLIPTTALAQEWSAEQLEVWAEIEKAWEAWMSADADAAYEYVHPDLVYWNSDNSVPGDRETAYSLDSAWFGVAGTKWHGATITPLTILVEDDIAIVHCYFRAYEERAGQPPSFVTERWMQVFKNEDGKWMELANYADFTSER